MSDIFDGCFVQAFGRTGPDAIPSSMIVCDRASDGATETAMQELQDDFEALLDELALALPPTWAHCEARATPTHRGHVFTQNGRVRIDVNLMPENLNVIVRGRDRLGAGFECITQM